MKEEDMFLGPPTPTNFSYGYAKRSLAVQIDAYNQQYGTKYNYLIPCNLYGEYDNFENENKMHFLTACYYKIIKCRR
jgi:GDP-L-fucose synthase